MGLDMYLKAKRDVSGYDFEPKEEQERYGAIVRSFGLAPPLSSSPHLNVAVNAAYWRKANAIHSWFVRNVQDGTDDCGNYEVTREQLSELVALCLLVLNKKVGPKDLPPQGGFFFGSTEIDEGYYHDLQDTVDQLTPLLNDPLWKGWDFEYHSSW